MAHMYTMACKLPPFDKVKMPPARSITFRVIQDKLHYGFFVNPSCPDQKNA